ncbi:MAG: hypothetical protein AMXMBFR61_25540 [Fimbriimonadales bacterium]
MPDRPPDEVSDKKDTASLLAGLQWVRQPARSLPASPLDHLGTRNPNGAISCPGLFLGFAAFDGSTQTSALNGPGSRLGACQEPMTPPPRGPGSFAGAVLRFEPCIG